MRWKTISYGDKYIEDKSNEFNKDSFITTLLLNRGIETLQDAENFLNPNFTQLHDPYLLDNMSEVINRILECRRRMENVLIFGDYDIDGISGSLYLSKMFDNLGIKNEIYIPSRNIFKYTFSEDFFEEIKRKKIDLIISVDNSFGEDEDILRLKRLGIDLIVTDHHFNNRNMDIRLEINPRKSKYYPFKELSGTGVVFKLVQALYERTPDRPIAEIYDYCELIALATIADVMECSDENRFLIKRGLKNFSRTKILAFKMILERFRITPEYISINDISYRIAPLINAVGKLNDPLKIIKFLNSDSEEDNSNTLNEMYEYNIERKNYESTLYNKIVSYLQEKNLKKINYIYYEINDINLGTLGSVASKLAVEYKVPVILVSKVEGYCKGSCRSVDDKNIYKVVEEFSDYYINFGGHDLATGFLMTYSNLKLIRERLKISLYKLSIGNKIKDEIMIDSFLPLSTLTPKRMIEINKLGPFAFPNSEPNFYDEGIKLSNILIFGVDNTHFRATIFKKGREFQILGYNLSNKLNLKKFNKLYKIIYTPELVDKKTIRLKLKDIE